jgi:hypothetical protein
MAAGTVYSSLFSTSGVPTTGRPFTPPVGLAGDSISFTVPATSLDDAGDFVGLLAVPVGKTLLATGETWADLDTGGGALSVKLVLRTTDKNGVTTDDLVVDRTTALAAAQATVLWTTAPLMTNSYIRRNSSANDFAVLGYLVATPASTPAPGVVTLTALWR